MNILIGLGIVLVVAVLSQVTFVRTLFLIIKVTPPYEQKVEGGKSLLVLGDSTGYGTGASNSKNSIAGLIGAEYPNLNITNNSKNGRTVADLRKDIESIEGTYDVILLQIGANDILQKRTLEETLEDLLLILDTLESKTKKIVMISSGNVGGAVRFKGEKAKEYQTQSIKFKEAFLSLNSERANYTYVDLYTEPENDPFVLESHIYTANDGLHPSDAGYQLWYEKLKPVLKETFNTL
jgi:lysophospholipase L1-like esterase